MLLAILALHQYITLFTSNKWIVARLDRVDVQLLTCRLEGQVRALAELVGDLILVDGGGTVEVLVMFQCELLNFWCLLTEED